MKINKIKPEFSPVVITIETENELEYFWHLINGANKSNYPYKDRFKRFISGAGCIGDIASDHLFDLYMPKWLDDEKDKHDTEQGL